MKKYKPVTIICMVLLLASCDKFLDEMPDNRTELDAASKITNLLVSAYPASTSVVFAEMASDNAMDNGPKFTVESEEHESAYLWEDITVDTNDSPKSFWDACYGAIAAANHALEAIELMGNPDNLQAQKGEALICRAYGHFLLANIFCLAYNPQTAEKDLGVPYVKSPETSVAPRYERGTMKQLYENIYADIEAGVPLINDEIYSVPKYHFNFKAANAFAARFNLFYHQYDKVIEYATAALGPTPESVMRNWNAIRTSPSNWQLRVDMYISANEPANLLMIPVTSSWGYWVGPYDLGRRYGHAEDIFTSESIRTAGVWGDWANLIPATSVWGLTEKMVISKIGGYFYYTDKVNGIGYRKNVLVNFSTDETILCRAEAHALKGDLDKAVDDINIWIKSHTVGGLQFTKEKIIEFYKGLTVMKVDATEKAQRSIKKAINPVGFNVATEDQENIIQCILHLRRIETVHEGLRWQDIKRYGIEFAHNRVDQTPDILGLDDPRRALQLPKDVINAGLQANPR